MGKKVTKENDMKGISTKANNSTTDFTKHTQKIIKRNKKTPRKKRKVKT